MAINDLLVHIKKCVPTSIPESTIKHPHSSELFTLSQYPDRKLISISKEHLPHFSIVSYNILADCYAHNAGYWYCEASKLAYEERHQSLLKELESIGYGSVLCFQEVTEKYYTSLLRPSLNELGYDGVFQQKNKRQKKSSNSEDGVATFYLREKCSLVCIESVILNELMISAWEKLFGNKNLHGTCYRDTVALITVLLIEDRLVAFGNVHIHWHWIHPEVQTLQGCLVLTKLTEFAKFHKCDNYFLCGDFNTLPSTELYEMFSVNAISEEMIAKFLSSDILIPVKQSKIALFATQSEMVPYFRVFEKFYTIPEPVKSAYMTIQGKEPEFTNYTGDFHGCLDYIFYSDGVLPVSVLAMPEEKDLKSEVALPNTVMSSDHLSIKAEFRFESK